MWLRGDAPMTGSTVNFTGTVDRDLLRRLKILAAKLATSINALFNAELRHLVETYEAAEAHGNHNFQTLLDFSLGRINDLQAMERLGVESEEDLFLLMARAHLPMPRLDPSATREMTEGLHSLAK
jgi:ribosome assembly protein YihI (activator of Der GTPase)